MLIDPRATASAKEVSSDVFLLGANSVDTGGIYLMGDRERLVKRAFMDGAAKVVLLVDNSKLTRGPRRDRRARHERSRPEGSRPNM